MKTNLFLRRVLWLMIPLLTMFTTNVWGADATISLDFEGSSGSWPYNSNWTCDASSNTTNHTAGGSRSAGMSKNGSQYITCSLELTNIKQVTLWVNRTTKNTAQPTITIQKSTDGGKNWSDITGASQTFAITKNTWAQKTFDFASYKYNGRVRIKYTNSTTAIKLIDDIVITYETISCTTSPTVAAASNSSVTATTATVSCSGGITSLGNGCSISSYGFVIGKSSNPEIGGSGVTQHEVGTTYTSTGVSFSKDLTGLTAETTYYVRPYATNGNGTAYGTQTSFTTSALPKYTVTLEDDGDTCTQASAGASVTLPVRAGCAGYTFAGWTKTWGTDQTEWTTTAPTIIPAGSYTPTANENLYPVYTKTEDGGGGSTTESYGWETSDDDTNWTISGIEKGSTYKKTGSNSGKIARGSGGESTITFKDKVNVTSFSFQFLKQTTNNNYNVRIETSTDGSSWDEVENYNMSAFSSKETWYAKSHSFDGKTALYVRFVCYTSTAVRWVDDISITYSGGSTTSYISVPKCCTSLGSINGSVSWSSTSATLTWDDIANVNSWAVACKNTSTGIAAGTVGSITTNGAGKKTCTITNLTCGGTGYTFTISATAASGYCDKSWELTGSTTACTDPAITVSPASLTGLDYIVGSGPSASQSFTVSGSSLGADLVVTAPANYEVCKTADGTYTSTISYTPSDGAVANTTAYIRLAAGLNVGSYNYEAASGLQVTSTGAKTRTAALNGSVTKAAGAIAFTDFNAVDHYEAELEKGMSDIDVPLTVSVTGDGSVSYSKSPAAGVSPTIPATQPTTTLRVLQPGIWTVTATLTAGTNYTGANTNCEVRVKRVDTYVDFIHNKTIKEYSSGATIVDGKMSDWGSGYTVPKIDDNAEETSGSCQQTHFKFIGWVSEDDINIVDGTFKPGYTIVTAGTEEKRSTSKTYYAIWAKLEE